MNVLVWAGILAGLSVWIFMYWKISRLTVSTFERTILRTVWIWFSVIVSMIFMCVLAPLVDHASLNNAYPLQTVVIVFLSLIVVGIAHFPGLIWQVLKHSNANKEAAKLQAKLPKPTPTPLTQQQLTNRWLRLIAFQNTFRNRRGRWY